MTQNITEPEIGTWIVRVGMFVIGFFLCLGVRDAKKSLDEVPGLKVRLEELISRVDRLEEKK